MRGSENAFSPPPGFEPGPGRECGHLHVRYRVCRVAGSRHQPGLRRRWQQWRDLPQRLRRALQPRHGRRSALGLVAPVRERHRHRRFGAIGHALTPLAGRSPAGHYSSCARRGGTQADGRHADIDRSTPIAMAADAGKVALVSSTTSLGCNGGSITCSTAQLAQIIDLVGYGTGATVRTSSRARRLRRHSRAPSPPSAAVRAAPTPTRTPPTSPPALLAPRNSATAPHSCTPGDAAPSVVSTAPTNTQTDVPVNSDVTIAFSEDVTVSGSWFSIVCPTSGTHTGTVTALRGDTYTINPDTDFAQGETCSVTVFADGVSDTDTIDPPDHMAADRTFSFSTAAPRQDDVHPRRPGHRRDTSPKVGETRHRSRASSSATSRARGQFSGFYVQEEDARRGRRSGDLRGHLRLQQARPVNMGDRVRVTAKVSEFGGMTELTPISRRCRCHRHECRRGRHADGRHACRCRP